MRSVRAWAHAGLGVVNAIGSGGYGAGTALDLWLWVEAWRCSGSRGYMVTRGERVGIDSVILDSVAEAVEHYTGRGFGSGLCARGETSIPLEAGLKGSSALINALLEAALGLARVERPGLLELARLGVWAAKRAGLTITGALDDHLVVSGCGTYATDNSRQELVMHWSGPSRVVVLVVPGRRSIRRISVEAFQRYRSLYLIAWRLLFSGEWGQAVLVNGVATLMATGSDPGGLLELVGNGAETVGVSGKGPAIYVVPRGTSVAELVDEIRKRVSGETIITRTMSCSS